MILGAVCALVQIAANLISYPVFLHYLGYRQYGIWLTLAVVLNVIQFVSSGFNPALMQAVAHSIGRGRREDVVHYLFWPLAGSACAGAGLLLLWPAALWAARVSGMDPALEGAIRLLGPWLAMLAAMTFAAECAGALSAGAGQIHRSYAATAAGQVVLLAASAALLAGGAGLGALVVGFAAARVTVLAMLGPVICRALGRVHGFRPSVPVLAEVLKAGGWMLAGASFNVFLVPLSRWCIAAANGVAAVPVFDIAYTGSMQIRNVLEFGLRALVPEAAGLRAQGSVAAIHKLHAVWWRRVLAAGAALYGAAAMAAPWVLALWLGSRLVPEQAGVLRVFLIAGFASVMGVPAYYLLVGLRRMKDVFWSYVAQAAVNGLVLAGALAGGVGDLLVWSGVAMSAAMLASTALLIAQVRRSGSRAGVEDPACCPV